MANISVLLVFGGLLTLASAAHAQTPAFATATKYGIGAGGYPAGVAVADVNGDRKPDILAANQINNSLDILLGNGTGTFQAAVSYPTGTGYGSYRPVRVVVADVNADGKLDGLVANADKSAAGVLLGNGDGTFQAPQNYAVGGNGNPFSLAVADVSMDGKLDIVTANYSTNSITVLLGNGDGTFMANTSLLFTKVYSTGGASNPRDITIADVNGDGKPDVLTANSGNSTLGVLLGNGDGTFQNVTSFQTSGSGTVGVAVADLNGDKKPDAVVANVNSSDVAVLLGNGSGGFKVLKTYVVGTYTNSIEAEPTRVVLVDINGDGKLDALTANSFSGAIGVLQGIGGGAFKDVIEFRAAAYSPGDVAVADVSGDGKPDAITANNSAASISILLNTTAYTPLLTRAALPGTSTTLAPNPAGAATTLAVAGLPATVAQVQATLLDATSRAVGQQILPVAGGSARTELLTAGLAHGLYVVRLLALDARGEIAGTLTAQRLSIE